MTKAECRHHDGRVPDDETVKVARHGGGNYRRAGRTYWSTICIDCAQELLLDVTRGQGLTSGRWEISSMAHALARYVEYMR